MTPAALARLHAAAFTTPRPWTAAEFAAFLTDPRYFLLAESAGFLLGSTVAGEAELLTLAVEPAMRRQGVARRLLAGFLSQAALRGATLAFLEVSADNGAALALYDSAGFRPVGRRKAYYLAPDGQRIDAVVLRRALDPIAPEAPPMPDI